jgi:hypothetical protein
MNLGTTELPQNLVSRGNLRRGYKRLTPWPHVTVSGLGSASKDVLAQTTSTTVAMRRAILFVMILPCLTWASTETGKAVY